jgi:pimeloyl-ACP methyl ester carboxylesterase
MLIHKPVESTPNLDDLIVNRMKLAHSLWKPETESQTDSKADLEISKILLLHGMGGTGALWRPIAASLEDHYEVLALDQRGHGKSQITGENSSTATYAPLDYGQDIIETLESLDFHPTWIVGHSMGVRSAIAAAHLKRDWVKGLILIDLGFSGPAGGGLGDGLAHFLRILPHEFESRAQARLFMQENCPDPAIAQYLMAVSVQSTTLQSSKESVSFPFDHAALIKTIEAVRDVSVRTWVQELASRGMPILVLRGAESGVWSHEEFKAERAHFKSFPSIVFEEFPGAGHGLPFEKRSEFVACAIDFMQGQT